MKSKQEKAKQLEEIRQLLDGAKSAVLVNFSGLTVAEDTDLRRKVREAGTTYAVYKNTLLEIACKEKGIEGLEEFLSKNTALCASDTDAVAPCKLICEYAKTHEKMQIKAGILEGKAMSAADVKALAALPPKEVLVAKMLGSMNAPISGLVRTLNGTICKVVYALDAVRQAKEKQSA